MLISHQHKFVFVHIPRTAGSSITEALTRGVLDIVPIHGTHSPISCLNGYCDYRVIAFVRNPWQRALSLYAYHVRRRRRPNPYEFFEFLSNPPKAADWIIGQQLMRQQVDYLDGNRRVRLGRFEDLEEDFKTICSQLVLGNLELRHRNSAARLSVGEYYNNMTLPLVGKLFYRDIAELGYSMLSIQ
jgi:hypothetical protein